MEILKRISILFRADAPVAKINAVLDTLGTQLGDFADPILSGACEREGISAKWDIERERWIPAPGLHDMDLILGALDSLGAALAEHGHTWTAGERAIYEQACKLLGKPPTGENDCEND